MSQIETGRRDGSFAPRADHKNHTIRNHDLELLRIKGRNGYHDPKRAFRYE